MPGAPMYYGGPAGYPQQGGRGPMGYPQQNGPGMPRPRFYAPPGQMPGMPGMQQPMAPYGQAPQQFNQYPAQSGGPPRNNAPRSNQPPQQLASGGRPLNTGAPLPPNGVARPPQAGQPMPGQAPRGVPAGPSAARAGYKSAPRPEETINGSGLTAATLANAAPQEQKQMLGEA